MSDSVYLDFETKSEVDLNLGGKRYAEHQSTDMVMLGFRINDKPTVVWVPPSPPPADLIWAVENGATIYAFNAIFDWRIWNNIRQRYGLPEWKIESTVDVMALCGRYTIPQSLDKAGSVLNTLVKKNPRGKALMAKICCPPFQYTEAEFAEFISYCHDDVDTMIGIINSLPSNKLSEAEHKAWLMTVLLNEYGVPVDAASTKNIYEVTSQYFAVVTESLPDITSGLVTTPNQVKRIKEWLIGEGVDVPNLQAETVETLLARDNLTPNARAVLEIRAELGQSSVKKYKTLHSMIYKGRVYDNFRYYGAATGRWSGMGFQLHNLPRAQAEDVDVALNWFADPMSMPEDTNPMTEAKGLVRSMLMAPPRYVLFDSDYTSIENILLAWVAEDWLTVDDFGRGFCQYSDMAAFLYKVPYEDIISGHKAKVKEMSHLRKVGKIIILGCGYAMSGKTLKATAEGYGVFMTLEEADAAVAAYRAKYKLVVSYWYRMMNLARAAIANKGQAFASNQCAFKVVRDRVGTEWLTLQLPSGRKLFYMSPEIDGTLIVHMGTHPKTKQWSKLSIIPGRMTENIIQALARDVLVHGKQTLIDNGYKVIASIHDQILAEVPEEGDLEVKFDEFRRLMCSLPEWAKTPRPIPLQAGGYIGKRFKKE